MDNDLIFRNYEENLAPENWLLPNIGPWGQPDICRRLNYYLVHDKRVPKRFWEEEWDGRTLAYELADLLLKSHREIPKAYWYRLNTGLRILDCIKNLLITHNIKPPEEFRDYYLTQKLILHWYVLDTKRYRVVEVTRQETEK